MKEPLRRGWRRATELILPLEPKEFDIFMVFLKWCG